jgi:hypothetical protein
MTIQTNVLALPLASMDIETGTYEDWIDTIVWLVNSTDPLTGAQLDLRGIDFELQVRRSPTEHEVIIEASTDEGSLAFATPPDYGYLIINLPASIMALKQPGDYVGDIVASDGVNTRVCVQFTLAIVQGITHAPSVGPLLRP